MDIDDLKKQKIWACWNYKNRNGNRTKVPKSAYGTPTGSKPKYAHTWVTYEEAAKAREKHGDDGLMFRLPEDCFFLDIDDRELEDPVVQKLVERFDTYTEYSVSGKGFHIYGQCDMKRIPARTNEKGEQKLHKDFYTNNRKNHMELYFGGFTNNSLSLSHCSVPTRVKPGLWSETSQKKQRKWCGSAY